MESNSRLHVIQPFYIRGMGSGAHLIRGWVGLTPSPTW